jgi:hypothetical protein
MSDNDVLRVREDDQRDGIAPSQPTPATAGNQAGSNRLQLRGGDQGDEIMPPQSTPETLPDNTGTARPQLNPTPLLTPTHRVDLSTVVMDALPHATPIESLEVREMKGIGATFTPNMAVALQFKGLVYKPEGEFESQHQIIAGDLLRDPRVVARTCGILFVPSLAWSTCDLVVVPFKITRFGVRVIRTLQSLEPRFPNFKVFIEWNDRKKKHTVNEVEMTPQECELIAKTVWPSREQLLDALQVVAFDNITELAVANDTIRTLLGSREVE